MKSLQYKIIAIFLALLIVSLTPAYAAQYKDVTNSVSDISKINKNKKNTIAQNGTS